MKFHKIIFLIFSTLSTYHCQIQDANSYKNKGTSAPYRSYIEFVDKSEKGGYGYKIEVNEDSSSHETQWKQQQENSQQHVPKYSYNSYIPQQHFEHKPVVQIMPQEYQNFEQYTTNGPQVFFESTAGKIPHSVPPVQFNYDSIHQSSHQNIQQEYKQPTPEVVTNPSGNYNYPSKSAQTNDYSFVPQPSPIKLEQLPIITKFVPETPNVQYTRLPKNQFIPQNVHYLPETSAQTQEESYPAQQYVKYVMLSKIPENSKQIEYVPQEEHQNLQYVTFPQKPILHSKHVTKINKIPVLQSEEYSEQFSTRPVHTKHRQVTKKVPIKYNSDSSSYASQQTGILLAPLVAHKQIENVSSKQNHIVPSYKHNYFPDITSTSSSASNKFVEQNLPNRLAHPPNLIKNVVKYHYKQEIPPAQDSQKFYEYKTIQEEDYNTEKPSTEFEILKMPSLINNLPMNTFNLQQNMQNHNIQHHTNGLNMNYAQNFGYVLPPNMQAYFSGNNFEQSISGYNPESAMNFYNSALRRSMKSKDNKNAKNIKNNKLKQSSNKPKYFVDQEMND